MAHWIRILGISLLSLTILGGNAAVRAGKIPAGSSKIQYFGRWDAQNNVCRCASGAAYIKAVFTGTSIKADLTDTDVWWQVSIDGNDFRRFRSQGRDTVLAEDLSPGMHTLLLVRATEGDAGVSEFRGFTLDDHATLLRPEPMKKRRLEFVGDSISAGAMNLGKYTGENYYEVEDSDMAYGPQLARMLDADYSVVANSGQGIAHNYAEQPPYTEIHAADSYGWTFPCKEPVKDNIRWDARSFPVDATIVSMGTNDFTDRDHLTPEDFKNGYRNLLACIRKVNPNKTIICVEPLPSWLGADARRWIREAVADMKTAGESNIYFIPVNEERPLLSAGDYTDGETHPNRNGSSRLAGYLKDKVAAILGWQ